MLNELAWVDAYGSLLLYGLSPKEMGQQYNQVVKAVKKNIKDKYFPELSNVSQLANVIDLRRTSFYPLGKADNESEGVPFDDLLKGLPKE